MAIRTMSIEQLSEFIYKLVLSTAIKGKAAAN
jgi:hypothetical protein